MSSVTSQPWFWPALLIVVGLPIALLLLQELHNLLARRNSSYARPVMLLRNWVLPALAAYLLIQQIEYTDGSPTWSKISATVFGFLIMLMVLSAANAALFGEARAGSWRDRLPGIFVDLGRLILIVIGIALLLSWVWGANIGGLITAGVSPLIIDLFEVIQIEPQQAEWLLFTLQAVVFCFQPLLHAAPVEQSGE
jgi:hypothetical protein